ncbi:MAG TPA: ATP synthase F0 subunit A [Balneolaceae bacterium]|nr:ATP synthase F0 subunit A [Balneolaceae bacterium]|tara:strand:- start:78976 stop:80079 length:1104 start_codon:yes stop_codon:yes gene_type:complete
MIQTLRRLFLTLLFLSVQTPDLLALNSDQHEAVQHEVETHSTDTAHEEEPVLDVMGTVADHDYFNFVGIHIYLPKIIYWEDAAHNKKFNVFSNTHAAVESGLFIEEDHAIHPADGGHIVIDFSITSHLVYFWLSMGMALLLTIFMAGRYKKGIGNEVEPKGTFQNIFEVLFVFIRDDVARANIDKHKADRYVPYLFTAFMGIAFMNLLGLLPWAATATADLTVTATLAIITFIITQFSGTKDHWMHVFWFPGVPTWVRAILTPVEILGLFTKPFALAIRLFANMLSGKIMIIAILGLIFIFADLFGPVAGYGVSIFSVVLTVVLYALKVFVGLLQAYIFTLLSAVFIGMAAEDHAHEEEHYNAEHVA